MGIKALTTVLLNGGDDDDDDSDDDDEADDDYYKEDDVHSTNTHYGKNTILQTRTVLDFIAGS